MSSFKEKSQIFIMGLMAGLIVAGAFFILKLDNYFKELNFYKNIVKTFTFKSAQKNNEILSIQEKEEPKKDKKNKETKVKNIPSIPDTSSINKPTTNFVLDADTIAKFTAKDSLTNVLTASQEEIVIRKDELLLTKTVEVINIGASSLTQNNPKDSLLQKVSGIKDDKAPKQLMNVELWHSPLNYKGYKMGKYKIILYGIISLDGLKIYTLENETFLKQGTTVYVLVNTSEFKPYERITDENIISKLK